MFQNKNTSDIRENKLFADVDFSALKIKFSTKEIINFPEGEIIYRPGDDANFIYLIISGEVKVKVPGGTNKATKVYKVGKLDFFGEKEVLENLPRNSSAVAETLCSLFPLKKSIIIEHSHKSKNLLSNLYRKNDPNSINIISSLPAQDSVNPDFILNTESAGEVFSFGAKPPKAPAIPPEQKAPTSPHQSAEDLSESFFKRYPIDKQEEPDQQIVLPETPIVEDKIIETKENNNIPDTNFVGLNKLDDIVNDESQNGVIDFDNLDENTIITDDMLKKQTVEHKFSFSDFSQDEVAENPYEEDMPNRDAAPTILPKSITPEKPFVKQPSITPNSIVNNSQETKAPIEYDVPENFNELAHPVDAPNPDEEDFFIDYETEISNSIILKNIPLDELDVDNLKPIKFSFGSEDDEKEADETPAPDDTFKTDNEIIKNNIIDPEFDFESELRKQREERRKSKEIILETFGLLQNNNEIEKTEQPAPTPDIKSASVVVDDNDMMVVSNLHIDESESISPKDKVLSEDELSARRKKTYDFSSEGFEIDQQSSPFDNAFIVPDPHPFDDDTPAPKAVIPDNNFDFVNDDFDIPDISLDNKIPETAPTNNINEDQTAFDLKEDFPSADSFNSNFGADIIEELNTKNENSEPELTESNPFDDFYEPKIYDVDDIESELENENPKPEETEIISSDYSSSIPDIASKFDFTSPNQDIDFAPENSDSESSEFPYQEFTLPDIPLNLPSQDDSLDTANNASNLFNEFVTERTELDDTNNNEFEDFISAQIDNDDKTNLTIDVDTPNLETPNATDLLDQNNFDVVPDTFTAPMESEDSNQLFEDFKPFDYSDFDNSEDKEESNTDSTDPNNSGNFKDTIQPFSIPAEEDLPFDDNTIIDNTSLDIPEENNEEPSSIFSSLLGGEGNESDKLFDEFKPFTFEDSNVDEESPFDITQDAKEEVETDSTIDLGEIEENILDDEAIKTEEPLFDMENFSVTADSLSREEELTEPLEPITPILGDVAANEEIIPDIIQEPLFEDNSIKTDEPLFDMEDFSITADSLSREEELTEPLEPITPILDNIAAKEEIIPEVIQEPLFDEDSAKTEEPLFDMEDFSVTAGSLSREEELSQPLEPITPILENIAADEEIIPDIIQEPLFDQDSDKTEEPLFDMEDFSVTADSLSREEELSEPLEPITPILDNITANEEIIPDIIQEPLFDEDSAKTEEPLFEPFDTAQIRNNISKGLEDNNDEESPLFDEEIQNDNPSREENQFDLLERNSGWDSISFTSALADDIKPNMPILNIPESLLHNNVEEDMANNSEVKTEEFLPEVQNRNGISTPNSSFSLSNDDKFLVSNLSTSFEYLLNSLDGIKNRLKGDEEASKLLGLFDEQAKLLQSNLDSYINYMKDNIIVSTELIDIGIFIDDSLVKIAGFYDSKGKKIFKKLNINEKLYVDKEKLFTALFELIKFLFSFDTNVDNMYVALVKISGSVILDIRIKEFILPEEALEDIKSHSNNYLLASEIITKHDSTLKVSAGEGKGTSIKIVFPIPLQ